MKYKYDIDSKNMCPNCGAKIEDKVRELDGVKDVRLAAIPKKFKIEIEDGANIDEIMDQVQKIADKIEPGTSFVGK